MAFVLLANYMSPLCLTHQGRRDKTRLKSVAQFHRKKNEKGGKLVVEKTITFQYPTIIRNNDN